MYDKHGGFVKGDGIPPSRYILAKSENISDYVLKLSTFYRQLERRLPKQPSLFAYDLFAQFSIAFFFPIG